MGDDIQQEWSRNAVDNDSKALVGYPVPICDP